MEKYFVISILSTIGAIFAFHMSARAKKAKMEQQKIQAEEQAKQERVQKLNDEIAKLKKLMHEIPFTYVRSNSTEEEKQAVEENNRKRKMYDEQIDALEEERYQLTGQITSKRWAILKSVGNPEMLMKKRKPEEKKATTISPYIKGVGAALLTNAVSKVQKSQTKRETIRSGGAIMQKPTPIYFVNNIYEPGVVKVYISNNKYENGVVKVFPTTNRYEQGVIKAISVDKYQAQMKVFLCKSRYEL